MPTINSIRFFIAIILISVAIKPQTLFAVDFKDIIFEEAQVFFTVEGNKNSTEVSRSNRVRLNIKKNDNSNRSAPKLQFFKYNKKSNQFFEISKSFYSTDEKGNKIFSPMDNPVLNDGQKIELINSIPLNRCQLFRENEPVFIIYESVVPIKKSFIDIKLSSKNDREIVRLLKSKEGRYFIGYINTTTTCQKVCDGKLYTKEGGKIEAVLKDFSQKINRSTNSKIELLKAVATISNKNIKSNNLIERDLAPKVWLSLKASKKRAFLGDFIEYLGSIENRGDIDIEDANLTITLFGGQNLYKNRIFIDGKSVLLNNSEGKFTTAIKLQKHKSIKIRYITQVDINAKEFIKSQLGLNFANRFLSAVDTTKIDKDIDSKGILVGSLRVIDSNRSDLEGVKLYLENGYYTYSDKFGRFHFDNINFGSHVVSIDEDSINGRFKALECQANARKMGSSISNFFTISSAKIKSVTFCLKEDNQTKDLNPKISFKLPSKDSNKMPQYNQNSFNKIELKERFLWPPKNFVPQMPTTKVAFLHKSSDKVTLYLNGERVDMLNFDGTQKSKDGKWSIDKYRGVDIEPGDNLLEMRFENSKKSIKRVIHLSTAPVKAELIESKSYLVADGKNNPVIAIRLTDMSGKPIRKDMSGEYSILKPYIAEDKFEEINLNPLQGSSTQSRYRVEDDGICYIKLHPTSISGEVNILFPFLSQGESIKAWLSPKKREWFIVGFAEGTFGYEMIKKGLKKSKKREHIQDKSISFFAKGTISSDILLTIAYNSSKKLKSLQKEFDTTNEFIVYGDSSYKKNDAPSSKKLYLKIEKKKFYALFGDFETGFENSQLARYSRVVNGVKSEFRGRIFSYKAFASKSENSFFKDELRGDGTSGLYHLKNRDIIEGSQMITIEIRDRYHSDKLINKRILTPLLDYNIDYQEGTIYFKEPIRRSDSRNNPIYIIVSYEKKSSKKNMLTYGTRVSAKVFHNSLEIGSSFIREENGEPKTLYGVDFKAKLSKNITFNGEIAKTSKNNIDQKGYLLEVNHYNHLMQNRFYYRYQERGFGLGQSQNSFKGKEKYSFESTLKAWQYYTLKSILYSDKNLDTKKIESVVSTQIEYNKRSFTASLGAKYLHSNKTQDMTQLTSFLSKRFYNNRFKLSAAHDRSLTKKVDSLPNRSFIELSYAMNRYIDLFVNSELQEGNSFKKMTTKSGFRGTLWRGSTISGSVANEKQIDSVRIFGDLGINQNWQIDKNSSISLSYDAKKSFKSNNSDDDYSAYSISYNKRVSNWLYNLKAEYKDAKKSDKLNLEFGAYTKINQYLGSAFSAKEFRVFSNESKTVQDNIKFSLGYRKNLNLTILNRLEYIDKKDNNIKNSKIINQMLIAKRLNKKNQIDLGYALKYTKDNIGDEELSSWIDSLGVEYIYDLNRRLELGVNLGLLHSYKSDNYMQLLGFYFGYNLYKNLYVGMGYNFKGYYQSDLNRFQDSQEGLFLKFRIKFDKESLEQILEHF